MTYYFALPLAYVNQHLPKTFAKITKKGSKLLKKGVQFQLNTMTMTYKISILSYFTIELYFGGKKFIQI